MWQLDASDLESIKLGRPLPMMRQANDKICYTTSQAIGRQIQLFEA